MTIQMKAFLKTLLFFIGSIICGLLSAAFLELVGVKTGAIIIIAAIIGILFWLMYKINLSKMEWDTTSAFSEKNKKS